MKISKPLAVGIVAILLAAGAAAAQTCNPTVPATAPASRYTDHGDGTVTDNATGLMWRQCGEGLSGPECGTGTIQTFTWQGALQQAQGVTFAGHDDWRLPNVKELATLTEKQCYDPAINLTLFPATPSTLFWSSSPYAGTSIFAWLVSFYDGNVYGYFRSNNYSVRLVRGGQ